METINPKSNFKFPQAALIQLVDKGLLLIDQDMLVLAPYGVDAAYKADLQAKGDKFRTCPTDEEMQGKEQDETEAKDAKATNLRNNIRTKMTIVSKVFPEGSGKYNMFGTKGLSEMDDNNLSRCGYRVVDMLNECLAQLPTLTQADIDALKDEVVDFDKAINTQDYVTRKRIATTHDRLLYGNDAYGKVVELFDSGKDYWRTRNYARYKDYVIYNTPSGGPELSGKVGSIKGVMLDTYSSLPPMEGLVSLEYVDKAIAIKDDGSFQLNNVPVECTQLWGTALAHKTFYQKIVINENKETDIEIRMIPGADDPAPPNK